MDRPLPIRRYDPAAGLPGALGHVAAWVFDLDNTLYPPKVDLFAQIDRRMKAFIAERLKMNPDEAFALQKKYFREFGTTLRGLMLVHKMEPEEFLDYVHAIDHSVLAPAPDLDGALAALPGRKLIFTNGSERHAVNVMERLGIARHFDGIFDIKAADYIPKPQPETYEKLVARHGIDPRAAAMFEDLARNLEPAAAIGMTTVLVKGEGEPVERHAEEGVPDYVHHLTHDLPRWLAEAAGR